MKVAVAGTGGLAQHIARAIIAEGYELIMLSRYERSELFSLGYPVVRVDYKSPKSLHEALEGVDTLISTVSNDPQLALIDASLVARVRRFAPAEFEGVPYERPILESFPTGRDKISTLNRLREERHRLQSTVFCCGILYEQLHPGGLLGSGVSTGSVAGEDQEGGREGNYLMDISQRKAVLPSSNESGGEVWVCLTAAEDVGKFVAKSLGIEKWPEQLRMRGERLTPRDIVKEAETAIGCAPNSFQITQLTSEELHDRSLDAEIAGDWRVVAQTEALIATQRGEFDFVDANLNALFPEVETVRLRGWLKGVWEMAE